MWIRARKHGSPIWTYQQLGRFTIVLKILQYRMLIISNYFVDYSCSLDCDNNCFITLPDDNCSQGHGPRPWPPAMAQGHGLRPWPKAMAFGRGPRPWPSAMAQGHGLWPWPPAMAISSSGGFIQGETPFQKLTSFFWTCLF